MAGTADVSRSFWAVAGSRDGMLSFLFELSNLGSGVLCPRGRGCGFSSGVEFVTDPLVWLGCVEEGASVLGSASPGRGRRVFVRRGVRGVRTFEGLWFSRDV